MSSHVFIATSLDGFIARPDGALDWLPTDDSAGDHGYSAFMSDIDAIVMGRNTYEIVLTFGAWPFKKPVVVLTSRDITLTPELEGRVVTMSGSPTEIVALCAARGWHRLYVDGGITIQRFLSAGLIERMIITRIPVIIGSGLPLFGVVPADIRLQHVGTRSYPNGLVQSEYTVLR